jgi:hypothetical protein
VLLKSGEVALMFASPNHTRALSVAQQLRLARPSDRRGDTGARVWLASPDDPSVVSRVRKPRTKGGRVSYSYDVMRRVFETHFAKGDRLSMEFSLLIGEMHSANHALNDGINKMRSVTEQARALEQTAAALVERAETWAPASEPGTFMVCRGPHDCTLLVDHLGASRAIIARDESLGGRWVNCYDGADHGPSFPTRDDAVIAARAYALAHPAEEGV